MLVSKLATIETDDEDLYAFDEDSIDAVIETEWSDLDKKIIDLSRIDCSTFIQFVFGWPMQVCHCEWQDLLSLNDRVVLWAPIEHGKTSQITARIVWELGCNPNIRIAIISNTAGLAVKILASVKQHIELNPRVQVVFPDLKREVRPKRFSAWHDDKIIVQRDDIDNKDYSVQALGVMGAVVGTRLDRAYLDDVQDFENTLHQMARERMCEWFDSSIESRMSVNGRIALIGTAWHRDDLMHVISKRKGWKSVRYDATKRSLWPELAEVGGKLCGWPAWRLEQKRKAIPVLEFNRQFRNLPLSEDSEIFRAQAIEQCFVKDEPWDPQPRPDWQIYIGVDLNVKKGEVFDRTSFFVGRTDGLVKIVLNIVCRNMNLPEILDTFHVLQARYNPVLFLVENNAAQDFIVQILQTKWGEPQTFDGRIFHGRVQGFTTGSNKADPILGIRGMTFEFEQQRWRIPDHPLTREWREEMLSFDPFSHTGDILMSSWLFHSACLKYRPRRARAFSVSSRD